MFSGQQNSGVFRRKLEGSPPWYTPDRAQAQQPRARPRLPEKPRSGTPYHAPANDHDVACNYSPS